MFFMENFFKRITDDFRHRELLPLKLLFFVHSSTIYVLYPYLTIHMRELGINIEETAIMSAVTPLVAIIMPPIAGMIADRIGNFKILLSLFSGLGGGAALLLLLVPVGRVSTTFPNNTIVEIGSLNGAMYLKTSEPHLCERVPKSILDVKMNVEACGLLCTHEPKEFVPFEKGPKTAEEESSAILGARNYTIYLKSGENTTDLFQYVLGPEDLPLYKENFGEDVRNLKLMKNKGSLLTTIRKLSKSKYFFPAYNVLSFQCFVEDDNFICSTILNSPFSQKTYSVKLNNTGETKYRKFFVTEMMNDFMNKSGSVASLDDVDGNSMVAVPLPNVENGLEIDTTILIRKCIPKCLATVPRKKICSNLKMEVEYDTKFTFWSYLVIRVFIGMIGGTAFAMFEGAVIAILREHKADYGLQRIYATIGGMISSPLSGWLIDKASSDKQYSDFTPAFYLYAALKIISAFLMLTINLEFKSPAKHVFKDVIKVLKQIEVIALFITCFILGTAWGYIESFLFWLLQDLGASGSLMGITIAVGGIAGLPLLVMSGPIIDKLGHANVLFIGFVFYAIRLAGYSVIYNPWMCLIFEAMESITSALSFTAAVTYAAKLSTPTTDSSIQGLLGGLYFGVGKGAGSLIGGFLMTGVGTRQTYRIFSATTLLTGCIYFLFNHFYIAKRPTQEKEKEKEIQKDTNEKKDLEAIPMSKVISKTNNYKTSNEENGIVNTGFVEEKNENKNL